MLQHDDGIIIVGAGECGVNAAFSLRKLGYGGQITLIGDEPHLPYERPPLSKSLSVVPKPIRESGAYEAAGIELVLGRAVAEIHQNTRAVELDNQQKLNFSKLLIATGARSRVFPGMKNTRAFRTLDDAQDILASIRCDTNLVIVGGGFIGLELAALASTSSASVTIFEAGDRVMARAVPPTISEFVSSRHLKEGVRFVYGATISTILESEVVCKDGVSYPYDVVVAGIGSEPNVGLAVSASLTVDNGIVVDSFFQTSHQDIFAAGDCCSFPHQGEMVRLESWKAAQEQGHRVAENMLGMGRPYDQVPWLWSDQYDLTLQVVGFMPSNGRSVTRPLEKAEGFIECFLDSNGSLKYAAGVGHGNGIAKEMRLLEVMIAKGAVPNSAQLTDPETNLKTLLRAT